MRTSNFALRPRPSLLDEAGRTAEEQGGALNQFINVAVAEKLAAIRTESFFRVRAHRANVPHAIELLERMGKGNPPMLEWTINSMAHTRKVLAQSTTFGIVALEQDRITAL
jgi:hypothetical protein